MSDRSKNLSILGSTGSIGRQTLDLVRSSPDRYNVVGLSAGENWETLAQQTREFKPERIGLATEQYADSLKSELQKGSTPLPELETGPEAIEHLGALSEAQIVVSAVTGKAGLPGTLAAVRAGKRVALANKESLLIAGSIIDDLVEKHDAELMPVDSEHSALFQLLEGTPASEVDALILTASGGPFRTWAPDQLSNAQPEDALDHPTWDMGDKITIDSATLMNKAIEIVEANHFFDVEPDRIEVLIHPESRVHAMVRLTDGALMTHMGPPDMKGPIQYALSYPERSRAHQVTEDFSRGLELHFEPPRRDVFPALDLGHTVAREGGTTGAVLNGANEIAVDAFLDERIDFPTITSVVKNVLENHDPIQNPDLETLLSEENSARNQASDYIDSKQRQRNRVQKEADGT